MSTTPSEFKKEIAEISKFSPEDVMLIPSTKNAFMQIYGMDKAEQALMREAVYFKELLAGPNGEKLKQCSTLSIQSSLLTLLSDNLSLSPSLQECTIVPIYSKATNSTIAKPWVMYSGKVKMLCQAKAISHIKCNEVVYEGDLITCTNGVYMHTKNFSRPDDAKRIGVLLIAVLPNRQERHVWLDKNELAKRKESSRNKSLWEQWTDQFWKKTAIHELFKYLPKSKMSSDFIEKFENDELQEYDASQEQGETIDTTHTSVVEPTNVAATEQDPIMVETLASLIEEHGSELMNADQIKYVSDNRAIFTNEQLASMIEHINAQLELLELVKLHGAKVLNESQIQKTKDGMSTYSLENIRSMINSLNDKINASTPTMPADDNSPPF